MRKRQILFTIFMFGLVALTTAVLSSPILSWAEESKLMPLELDGTEWNVTMVYVTAKGKKNSSEDKLVFKDKKFISEGFDRKGYDPTNYSATIQDDGTTKFGTMQIKGKDTSFWKGTIKDGAIDGSVHTQFSGGDSKRTTYFNGDLITGELKRKPKRPVPPPPPPPAPEPVVEEVAPVVSEAENAVEQAADPVEVKGVEEGQAVVEKVAEEVQGEGEESSGGWFNKK